jgi:hypothetical protein
MSMGLLLDRAAFLGPALDLGPVADGAFAGQATFDGAVVTTHWPRTEVERLLPPELELAPSASDLHAVLFTFGDQTRGTVVFGGSWFQVGTLYREFGIAIPFVRRRGGRNLHLYVVRMFSDSYPAYWYGNASYGLGKVMATLAWDGRRFAATTAEDDPLTHADVEPVEPWRPAAEARGFAVLRAALALPIAGRRDDGTFVSSYFRWEIDEAEVRPAHASVSVDAPLVDGVPRRRLTGVPGGTFAVRGMLWRITWPMACRF